MGTRNLNQLYDECKAELKSIGIEPNPIKEIRVNPRPKRRLGRARCRNGEYTIEISGITLREEVPDKKVKQVIIHEMLHCCDGALNHGDTWKRLANKVNLNLGYNVTRCGSLAEMGLTEETVYTRKYKITCQKCGSVYYRERASNVTKHPERYVCAKCGGNLVVEDMRKAG